MRKLILLLFLLPFTVFGQIQKITLDSCQSAAKQNWPAFKKQLYITGKRDLISKILNKNYLPKINISGQATYQSESVSIPTAPNFPNIFPDVPLDNYNVEASLNQIIWDGGNINSTKLIRYADNDIEVQNLNIETYNLYDKINKLYMNYLLLSKSIKIISLTETELEKNIQTLSSAVNNGVLLESKLNNLKAEKLKLDNQLISLKTNQLILLNSINLITGLNLTVETKFVLPVPSAENKNLNRPDLAIFDNRISLLDANIKQLKTNLMPKLIAFGKVGYGRPGYDFFNTDMHGYSIVGAKLSWNVWNWNMNKQQIQQINLQKNILIENKESFAKQLTSEQQKYLAKINQYQKQISIDKQIEKLKTSVYKSSKSQLKNGTITSTEFLKQFNGWKKAKLATEIDKLNLITNKINYQHSLGIKN